MNTIECKVVRIPSNDEGWDKGDLITITNGHLDVAVYDSDGIDDWRKQNLFFTSDAPIKEGDLYIDDTNQIRYSVTSDKDYWSARKLYKKIESCTGFASGVPSIPKSFIRKYVTANGLIDKVQLATEYRCPKHICNDTNCKNMYMSMESVAKVIKGGEVVILDDTYQSPVETSTTTPREEIREQIEDKRNKIG